MISYIYTIAGQGDARAVISAGANRLILSVRGPAAAQKGHLSPREIKKILAAKANVQVVLRGFGEDPGHYMDLAAMGADIVQICGSFTTNKEFYRVFKLSAPHVKLMQTMHAKSADDITSVQDMAYYCDYLYLIPDSLSVAKQIIMAVGVPVVLQADGLERDMLSALDPYGAAISTVGKDEKKDLQAVSTFCGMIQTL